MAFIVGAPRSGSTLLRVMLAGHPKLWSPPEMLLSPFTTMAEREQYLAKRYWEKGGLRRGLMDLKGYSVEQAKAAVNAMGDNTVPETYAELQKLLGPRMLIDKCPQLTLQGPAKLRRAAAWFTEPRFIWLVRHPGSVIRSAANMPMAEVISEGLPDSVETYWRRSNEACRDALADVPEDRWTRIQYEDLVTDPETTMRRVCKALGVQFHPAVLDPYEGDRMREGPKGARAVGDSNLVARGAIQPELAEYWLVNWDPSELDTETRELAESFGYEIDLEHTTPVARLSQHLDALWDTAREIEHSIDVPVDVDAVEGRRFLLRMLSSSVDTFVEHFDVDRPEFVHVEGPTRKMFADCPDADYLRAPLKTGPGRVYRIWGRVPEPRVYFGVMLYGKGGRVGRRLRDDELGIAQDGSFELRISTEHQEGAWLEAEGDETAVIVRQYFTDRERQPAADVHVELERPAPGPRSVLDPDEMAGRVHRANRMLRSTVLRTLSAYRTVVSKGLNRFHEITGDDLFPTPDNRYQVTWYRFAPGQVLLIRGRVPKSRYYSLTLCNAWLESLDYRRHRCILNHTQLQTGPHGMFEVCLANKDPGHANWLDVAGHYAGYVIVRALLPEEPATPLKTQVMFESEFLAGKVDG